MEWDGAPWAGGPSTPSSKVWGPTLALNFPHVPCSLHPVLLRAAAPCAPEPPQPCKWMGSPCAQPEGAATCLRSSPGLSWRRRKEAAGWSCPRGSPAPNPAPPLSQPQSLSQAPTSVWNLCVFEVTQCQCTKLWRTPKPLTSPLPAPQSSAFPIAQIETRNRACTGTASLAFLPGCFPHVAPLHPGTHGTISEHPHPAVCPGQAPTALPMPLTQGNHPGPC